MVETLPELEISRRSHYLPTLLASKLAHDLAGFSQLEKLSDAVCDFLV